MACIKNIIRLGLFPNWKLYRNFGTWYQNLHSLSVYVKQLIKNYKVYILGIFYGVIALLIYM